MAAPAASSPRRFVSLSKQDLGINDDASESKTQGTGHASPRGNGKYARVDSSADEDVEEPQVPKAKNSDKPCPGTERDLAA